MNSTIKHHASKIMNAKKITYGWKEKDISLCEIVMFGTNTREKKSYHHNTQVSIQGSK